MSYVSNRQASFGEPHERSARQDQRLVKDLRRGRDTRRRCQRRRPRARTWRDRAHHGSLGLRQDDAPVDARRAAPADHRRDPDRRCRHRRAVRARASVVPGHPVRVHLPGLQPDRSPDDPRERRSRAQPRRRRRKDGPRPRRASSSSRWVSPSDSTSTSSSSQAARSSASRSPEQSPTAPS